MGVRQKKGRQNRHKDRQKKHRKDRKIKKELIK